MQWFQTNFLTILAIWGALNVVLSPVAARVPATTWYGKALHVFMAVGPLDVLKVVKSIGAAAAPPMGTP